MVDSVDGTCTGEEQNTWTVEEDEPLPGFPMRCGSGPEPAARHGWSYLDNQRVANGGIYQVLTWSSI